jgi:phage terminase large subunit
VYNWFVLKKFTKSPEEYEWFGGKTIDNPYTPQEYKDTLEASYSGVFYKQELLGEFVGHEGLVYPEFSRNVHVGHFQNKTFSSFVGGLDWGWTNPSGALFAGRDGDGRYYIVSELYEKRVETSLFAGLVKGLRKGRTATFYADPSEPQFIQMFNDKGIDCLEADNEILPGINKVASLLKIQKDGLPRLFIDESCVHLINEFENYRYPDKKEDSRDNEKPLKMMDHLMDCIRYLVMADDAHGVTIGFLDVVSENNNSDYEETEEVYDGSE